MAEARAGARGEAKAGREAAAEGRVPQGAAARAFFSGCFLPPLRAICGFAGDEDAVALRYLSASTRALLPLAAFPRLPKPETLRGTLCLEAVAELCVCPTTTASLVAALLNPHSIQRVVERARAALKQKETEEEEAREDAGAGRIIAWALCAAFGSAYILPLLQINEAHAHALLRCRRYRRRVCALAEAGLLRAGDPAHVCAILSRGLRRYADTLVYVQGIRAQRLARRLPVTVYVGAPPPDPSAPLDPYGLTPAQRDEVAELMIYPPPTSISDVAAMAADLALLERLWDPPSPRPPGTAKRSGSLKYPSARQLLYPPLV